MVSAKLNKEMQRSMGFSRENETGFVEVLLVYMQVYLGVRFPLDFCNILEKSTL